MAALVSAPSSGAWRSLWAIWSLLAAGAAIFLCSLISPAVTRILYVGLTLVAMPIGLVVSFILLAAFYFLLLTPLALCLPAHRHGMHCRRRGYERRAATSYWVPHKPNEDMERYFHQF